MGLFDRSWLSKARRTIQRAKNHLNREIKRPKKDLTLTHEELNAKTEHLLGLHALSLDIINAIDVLESHATPAPKRERTIREYAPLETLNELHDEIMTLLRHFDANLDHYVTKQERSIEATARRALNDFGGEHPRFLLSIIARLEHLEHHPPPAAAQADIDELVRDLHAIEHAINEHARLENEEQQHLKANDHEARFNAFIGREEHASTHGELKHLEQLRDRLKRFFADHHINH